mmetsp:Transcript_15677/g.31664  ORF Transcript_15677/g.31664 Transcript_15677/m.31664 type:complete len:216 (-) Transcript_15677:99-746(-)
MSEFSGPLTKLVNQIYSKADAEPFREPVDWKALGLFDYPQIIKRPMDLGKVKENLQSGKYRTAGEAADDIRLVWKNCMTYNADGSDFYNLAKNMSKKFEDKYAKLEKELNAAATGAGSKAGAKGANEPTLEEKRVFAKNLYKISKEDLGKVVVEIDTKCPSALTKNSAEDEVEVNVDMISPAVFHSVSSFVKAAAGGDAGKKKKTAGAKRKSTGD